MRRDCRLERRHAVDGANAGELRIEFAQLDSFPPKMFAGLIQQRAQRGRRSHADVEETRISDRKYSG